MSQLSRLAAERSESPSPNTPIQTFQSTRTEIQSTSGLAQLAGLASGVAATTGDYLSRSAYRIEQRLEQARRNRVQEISNRLVDVEADAQRTGNNAPLREALLQVRDDPDLEPAARAQAIDRLDQLTREDERQAEVLQKATARRNGRVVSEWLSRVTLLESDDDRRAIDLAPPEQKFDVAASQFRTGLESGLRDAGIEDPIGAFDSALEDDSIFKAVQDAIGDRVEASNKRKTDTEAKARRTVAANAPGDAAIFIFANGGQALEEIESAVATVQSVNPETPSSEVERKVVGQVGPAVEMAARRVQTAEDAFRLIEKVREVQNALSSPEAIQDLESSIPRIMQTIGNVTARRIVAQTAYLDSDVAYVRKDGAPAPIDQVWIETAKQLGIDTQGQSDFEAIVPDTTTPSGALLETLQKAYVQQRRNADVIPETGKPKTQSRLALFRRGAPLSDRAEALAHNPWLRLAANQDGLETGMKLAVEGVNEIDEEAWRTVFGESDRGAILDNPASLLNEDGSVNADDPAFKALVLASGISEGRQIVTGGVPPNAVSKVLSDALSNGAFDPVGVTRAVGLLRGMGGITNGRAQTFLAQADSLDDRARYALYRLMQSTRVGESGEPDFVADLERYQQEYDSVQTLDPTQRADYFFDIRKSGGFKILQEFLRKSVGASEAGGVSDLDQNILEFYLTTARATSQQKDPEDILTRAFALMQADNLTFLPNPVGGASIVSDPFGHIPRFDSTAGTSLAEQIDRQFNPKAAQYSTLTGVGLPLRDVPIPNRTDDPYSQDISADAIPDRGAGVRIRLPDLDSARYNQYREMFAQQSKGRLDTVEGIQFRVNFQTAALFHPNGGGVVEAYIPDADGNFQIEQLRDPSGNPVYWSARSQD